MVKKEPKKKAKVKASNGANGAHVPAPPQPVAPLSFRAIKFEMEDEVCEFKNRMVEKYSNFHGHDLRRDLSWYMEQMGIGIASDLERAKREERNKVIAANQEAEKLAAETQKLDGAKK